MREVWRGAIMIRIRAFTLFDLLLVIATGRGATKTLLKAASLPLQRPLGDPADELRNHLAQPRLPFVGHEYVDLVFQFGQELGLAATDFPLGDAADQRSFSATDAHVGPQRGVNVRAI